MKNLTKYFRQTNLRLTANKTFSNLVKILTIFRQPFPPILKQKTKEKDAARLNLTASLTISLILFFCRSYIIRPFPPVIWFLSITNKPYSAFPLRTPQSLYNLINLILSKSNIYTKVKKDLLHTDSILSKNALGVYRVFYFSVKLLKIYRSKAERTWNIRRKM